MISDHKTGKGKGASIFSHFVVDSTDINASPKNIYYRSVSFLCG
jgi:hypothetical protein